MMIRKGEARDASEILSMIKALALFEKSLEQVELNLETFLKDGFGVSPIFESIVIEEDSVIVGFALYYNRYSTWKGKTLYLEDLYVKENYRNKGHAKKMMIYLAKEAVNTNCGRFEWQVLDWNEPAIEFYKKIGTEISEEWLNCRLEGSYIVKLSTDE